MTEITPYISSPNSDTIVTSKETAVGGGLNLAVKRAKPNNGSPVSVGPKSQEEVAIKKKPKKQTARERIKNKLQLQRLQQARPRYLRVSGQKRALNRAAAPRQRSPAAYLR